MGSYGRGLARLRQRRRGARGAGAFRSLFPGAGGFVQQLLHKCRATSEHEAVQCSSR